MPSNAISGVGAQFMRNSATSIFAALAEVNQISGPSMTRDFIEVTSLDSTGGYREFIGGFRDGGQVTLNMNFTRDNYILLLADFDDDTAVDYQIILADTGATTLDFTAFVTDMPLTVPTDDKVTVDVTLKVTGQITVTS